MRVLIAPDGFGGTLTAPQAAAAIAAGWAAGAPGTTLTTHPLSDGGPGFVDVLHAALGGRLQHIEVRGPLGDPVTATWLEHERTAYLESAQACGLHLVAARDPLAAHTEGVGELVADAVEHGLRTVVLGLGGTATSDGGAGFLRTAGDLAGVELVAASDVDNSLLGEHGAARTFGPQKGADADQVAELECRLADWADELAARTGRDVRDLPGAGAAGGLGAALLALGARRVSGAGLVRALTGFDTAVAGADLVVTGEGSFDWQSLRGKVLTMVAGAAAERGVPCVVLAGQVAVGRRQAASIGVDEAHAVVEHAGSVEAAFADPAGTLTALAAQVATNWRGR